MSTDITNTPESVEMPPEASPTPSPTVIPLGNDMITIVESEDDLPPETSESDPAADPAPQEDEKPDAVDTASAERARAEAWYRQQAAELHQARETSRVQQLQAAELTKANFDFQLKTSIEAMVAAAESGDVRHETELKMHIDELKARANELGGVIEQLKKPTAQPRMPAPPSAGPGIASSTPLAHRYAASNAWMRDPAKAPELQYFLTVDKMLVAEGKNPNDPKYYAELTQRVAKAFPNLQIRDLDGKKPVMIERQRGAGQKSPVAGARGVTSGDARSRQAASAVKPMGPVAIAIARSMGKDPNDPKVQAAWAKIKGGRA